MLCHTGTSMHVLLLSSVKKILVVVVVVVVVTPTKPEQHTMKGGYQGITENSHTGHCTHTHFKK
jgi:hypothetical protein